MWLFGRDPAAADVGSASAAAASSSAAATTRLLFDLIAIVGQNVPEARPALLRNGDGRTKVRLHFGNAHVYTAIVLSYVEIEVFVVDVHVPALGQVRLVSVLVRTEFVEEVGEGVAELDHTLRGYGHLHNNPQLVLSALDDKLLRLKLRFKSMAQSPAIGVRPALSSGRRAKTAPGSSP